MRSLLIVALILAVAGVVLIADRAVAQERQEVMVLIPLKYMSAATAAQLFGGTIISPGGYYGHQAGPRYGGYRAGSRIGNARDYDRGRSSYGGSYGTSEFGRRDQGYPFYNQW